MPRCAYDRIARSFFRDYDAFDIAVYLHIALNKVRFTDNGSSLCQAV